MKKILKNKENIVIFVISVIAFIAGCLALGWLKSLIIIGLADLIIFLPNFIRTRKRRRNPSKTKPMVKEKGKRKKLL